MDGKVHFIFKCRKCERVTGQCRCPAPMKKVKWVECCATCASEGKK